MLESFLSNRKQYVKNGLKNSNWVTISHGVPQESILGPLFFILYINNFKEEMKKKRGGFCSLQMTDALFVVPNSMTISCAK